MSVEEQQTSMALNPSVHFTWSINNFLRISEKKIYSDVFTAGGCKWRILAYPKGNDTQNYFSMYLDVADTETLPTGWSIDAHFSLTLVNQMDRSRSYTKETGHHFTARKSECGYRYFKELSELHNSRFLFQDSLVLEVDIRVSTVIPSTGVGVNRLDTFFSGLGKFISDAAPTAGPSLNGGLKSEVPTLEEVEMAKQSLKECLSDLFKLNMKDRLATSLETLSRATIGISLEQQQSIQMFWGEFDDFVSDFLTFEQDNSDFELQKLGRDQMFSSLKKNHESHISNKKLLDDLNNEEDELKKRMQDVKSRQAQLILDWERLMVESEETKDEYTTQEKKLVEAEEKKRIAEERMSRSTSAWSSLKAHFV